MMATHIEYDEWKRGDEEKVVNNKVPKSSDEQKQIENMKSKFDELFS